MESIPAPGQWVRLASAPEWGPGQVRSAAGRMVAVNFEHAGKRVELVDAAPLEPVEGPAETS